MVKTVDELFDAIGRLDFKEADEAALQFLLGAILYRIHNEGKASDESLLGEYTEEYKKVRRKLGRQVNYKDLELTGHLRRSAVVVVEDKLRGLAFSNQFAADKSRWQEEQTRKTIWHPTKGELDEAAKIYIEVGSETINNAIKGFTGGS